MSTGDIKVVKVPIQLGDEERNLGYDMNAFCELEERFGGMEEAFEKLQKGSLKAVRFILWCGLIHEDEQISEKKVGSLISMKNINYIAQQLSKALEENLPNDPNQKK